MNAKIFNALILGLLVPASLANAAEYNLTDLGPGFATSINNAGQVAGANGANNATVWNGTTPTVLDALGGSSSVAFGINDSGQVVGTTLLSGDHAIIWNGGVPTDLAPNTGGVAFGINNAGQTVGFFGTVGATVWNGGVATSLPAINPSGNGAAYGINNIGQVVGWSTVTYDPYSHATIWNGATPTELTNLPSEANSFAYAINSAGEVVGVSSSTDTNFHGVIWNGTTPTDLGLRTEALGINDGGQVVGYMDVGLSQLAALWDNGSSTAIDLNTLLGPSGAGWTLEEATAINLVGQIVGYGINPSGNETEAFLLTPCGPGGPACTSNTPLPTTLPLFASGLGALGLLGWRRKRKVAAIGT